MGQVLAVSSGKGGTGKTTLCAGIAACLAAEGQRVLCIDADISLRNLDISLGIDDLPILPFTEVLNGHCTLDDATEHPDLSGLFLLTAPTQHSGEAICEQAFGALLQEARKQFDWCLIDAPAGVGSGFRLATGFADQVLVVSTADPSSLRDAAAAADLLTLNSKASLKLVVNRVKPRMLSKIKLTIDDLMDGVGIPLLGIVPEDVHVTLAAAQRVPLVLYETKGACVACLHIARRLRGEKTKLMKL